MAGETFVVVDRGSLDEALAEADSRDRIVVAEGAFAAVPRLAVDGARWRMNGWTAPPGGSGVTSSVSSGNYAPFVTTLADHGGYARTWAALARTFDLAFARVDPPPVPRDTPDLLAVARAVWAERGMDVVGRVTEVEVSPRDGYDDQTLRARAHDGAHGWAELRIDHPLLGDPAVVRHALARAVDKLASRKPPLLPLPPGPPCPSASCSPASADSPAPTS